MNIFRENKEDLVYENNKYVSVTAILHNSQIMKEQQGVLGRSQFCALLVCLMNVCSVPF